MTKMIITIDTLDDGDTDPEVTDPHDIAEDVVTEYNRYARANGEMTVSFVDAEWID